MSVTVAFGLPARLLQKRKNGTAAILDDLDTLSLELSANQIPEEDVGRLPQNEVLAMLKAISHYQDRVYPVDVVKALQERKIDPAFQNSHDQIYLARYNSDKYNRQMQLRNDSYRAAHDAAKSAAESAAKSAAESAAAADADIQMFKDVNSKLRRPALMQYVSKEDLEQALRGSYNIDYFGQMEYMQISGDRKKIQEALKEFVN